MGSTQLEINNIVASSGNFTSNLQVNGTGVSIGGHTHITSDISDSTAAGRALLTAVNSAAQRTSLGLGSIATLSSGTYALSSHTHTSSDITNFNSGVSGLLPVTNIVAGSNITISSSSGIYTINSTGGGSSSVTGVYEYTLTSNFPATGAVSGIYIATDSNRMYRWIDSTNKYVEVGSVGGGDTSLWNLFLPGAPTNVIATPGNSQVSLSWTAPTGVATQTPVTDYVVQYSANSGSTWTTFNDGISTTTAATVTGLTNGSGYIFRTAAINIIGTGIYSTSSSTVTPTAGDSLFGNVSLLLRADGSGSSFVDSSPYSRTVTANGNATQSSAQSKFGGSSALFDGAGDWLSISSIPDIGTDDFVIEWWMRIPDVSAYQHIIGTSSNGNFMVALLAPFNGAGAIGVGRNNIAWDFVRNATLVNNTWHHIAISRSGGTMRLYVDGSIVGSSASNSQSYSIGTIEVGATSAGSTGPFNGYIDDLRLTIGNSRGYTGSTITVPTVTYPNTSTTSDSFFSTVGLLLHMDGTTSTFTDSSSSPKTITANGSATQSASQSKFGGKSLSLDGTNSFLTFPSSSVFNYSNDFTIECWVYPTSLVTYATIIEGRTSPSFQNYICGLYNIGGVYRLDFVTDSGQRLTGSSTSVSLNTWSHIAFVRSGSTLRCYVNGVQDSATLSYSGPINAANSTTLTIGKNIDGNYFAGFIDEYRITKNVARYTSTFTPTTSAFPDT